MSPGIIMRVTPEAMEKIVLGQKTEVRTPVTPAPVPSDSPAGYGWRWYPEAGVKSHYVWDSDLPGLLRAMVHLGYSPYPPEGGEVGFVVDWSLPNLRASDMDAVPTIACKARVVRSWAEQLDHIAYDSIIRLGYETKAGLSYAGLDPDSEIDEVARQGEVWSRVIDDLQKLYGADRVKPDSFVWAMQFEVTEAMRP